MEEKIESDFVPVPVAADFTGYTPAWVRRLQKRGLIRAQDDFGRTRVSLSDLLQYQAQCARLGVAKFAIRYREEATTNAQPAQ